MNSDKRAFLKFGILSAAALAGFNQLLKVSPHHFNEAITRKLFGARQLAPVFPRERAAEPKENGMIGLDEEIDPTTWRLQLETPGQPNRTMTLDEIKAFPKVEMTTELMCIEGWSEIVNWGGTSLSHIIPTNAPDYLSLATPDKTYYVGLDLESALHPQTLLVWEMNGQPLTPEHGAPLRLVIPVKYGIKNIKRIGTIAFLTQRPADYWAERGYDWYSAL
ncbi:molybdopterin-dependent oxidoreductase [Bryobacter aggregatus]|uniref:molybdopterin-dependent oxidoreductase n=1 Tax=Bryobacter aggregatus TaxID=360054 RepID=UPI00068B4959|nr:molybdopterin-dependent oxidoreductase [Bryobacter aggregatus]